MAFVPPVSTEQVMMTIDRIEMVENKYVSSPLWEQNNSVSAETDKGTRLIYQSDFLPNFSSSSSSERIAIDNLRKERRVLYSLFEEYNIQDDETRPLDYFDELLKNNEKAICFEQVKKIFQTAYSKGLMKIANNVLIFLSNYDSDEVGEVGVAIASMALQNKENCEMQYLSLSLINKWKSKEFIRVLKHYQVPDDVFLKMKFRKIMSIYK